MATTQELTAAKNAMEAGTEALGNAQTIFEGKTTEVNAATAANQAVVDSMGYRKGLNTDDPNTTLHHILFGTHANMPDIGYWHIYTSFDGGGTPLASTNRSQIGVSHGNANPRLKIRHMSGGVFSPWAEMAKTYALNWIATLETSGGGNIPVIATDARSVIIGGMCHSSINLVLDGVLNGAGGSVILKGQPKAAISVNHRAHGAIAYNTMFNVPNGILIPRVDAGSDIQFMKTYDAADVQTNTTMLQASDLITGGVRYLQFSIAYQIGA
ncbi:MAG: hypothetical protein HRU28_14530 [Rhizobiales bacterium]|nr:hypothetical protein [Hyphomicrobiales bacterium]